MLARFDDVFPLPTGEQDWQTTYYGGQGFFTSGLGIQRAIDQGSLVGTILASPTPASVPVHPLCGGTADIPTVYDEHTGLSDGVVFIRSCCRPSATWSSPGRSRPWPRSRAGFASDINRTTI